MSETGWAIALHGGAGVMRRETMDAAREAEVRAGLAAALAAGREVLDAGGSSLDAVQATVCSLEDNPCFNAGHGSVMTSDGTFELEAAIMRGSDLAAGGVINVSHIRNPVSLARYILDHSEHVVFAGAGAERYAAGAGFELISSGYFETEMRRAQFNATRASGAVTLDHDGKRYGTVGAVARDRAGSLAAATSTGGLNNKAPGRVGDSGIIGGGTYANDKSCAVSATGRGEAFMRMTVARDIAAMIEYGGVALADAVERKVMTELPVINGRGGVIALTRTGAPVLQFNTPGMYRAAQCEGEAAQVAVFAL
ncbi:isoaspartyl peptidase/L-asparaginase family protein [Leisingera thetidis]|uniref:isoaspartyl peptidase/L-asparaginase family protein n=1 Tax=Leisingera thetidis TaxID=2930199 RepID=UPI0021F6AC70|nr:isoaspartyl peptidase/L-asparaginase [Leisingera thetidis]